MENVSKRARWRPPPHSSGDQPRWVVVLSWWGWIAFVLMIILLALVVSGCASVRLTPEQERALSRVCEDGCYSVESSDGLALLFLHRRAVEEMMGLKGL